MMAAQINLFNPDLLPRKIVLPARWLPWVLLAGFSCCVLLALSNLLQSSSAQSEALQIKNTLDPLLAESAQLQAKLMVRIPNAELSAEVRQLALQVSHRQPALSLLEQEDQRLGHGFTPQLLALARQTTEGVWLTRIDLSTDAISLQGRATSADKLPHWLSGLQREADLAGSRFDVFELVQPDKGTDMPTPSSSHYQFELKSQRVAPMPVPPASESRAP